MRWSEVRGTARTLAILGLGLATACGRGGEERLDEGAPGTVETPAGRGEIPPGLRARLDSANAAFEADDFDTALRHYRAVAEGAPEVAAGWFGIYMVHEERGEEGAAAEALERAREVAPRSETAPPDGSP